MHSVIETEMFARAAKSLGFSEDERHDLVTLLSENPAAGEPIRGTGGARKLRFGRGERGKRSGYRVVTFYTGVDTPVFLMDIYGKGERIDLPQSERNDLKRVLSSVADDYRRSVKEKVTNLSRKKAS